MGQNKRVSRKIINGAFIKKGGETPARGARGLGIGPLETGQQSGPLYTREERVLIEIQKRKHSKSLFGTVPLDNETLLVRALAEIKEKEDVSR